MRKAFLGAASVLTLASPAIAADLQMPRYSEVPTYQYRPAPPVVVEEEFAPVIVAPPAVVLDEYPVYVTPRAYAAPPVYAYAGPVWRDGWGHRRHFRGGW